MAHKPFRRPQDASTQTPAAPFAGQGALGTILLLSGAGIVLLILIDRTAGLPFEMPRSWYSTPLLWYFLAFIVFLTGARLAKATTIEDRRWQPDVQGQRFEKVVIYTREECHLCHQAKDVLYTYRRWLPEIEEVDIAESPELLDKFSEHIPVVEIDGQTRFRGRVNEVLLRRLIDATPPNPSAK